MEAKSSLKYARIGAFKARLVADLVRGQEVNSAVRDLTFSTKKAAGIIKKLIESAAANAENKQVMNVDNLYVKTITKGVLQESKRRQVTSTLSWRRGNTWVRK